MLTAIVLVVAGEVILRLLPIPSLLGYGEGLGTYYEVRHTIEEIGVPEVAILGSSRGRESVVMPRLIGKLEAESGRAVKAANFSCPDAKTNEMLLVTRAMEESTRPPRIVIYVISPRALLGNERSMSREEVFGVFPGEYSLSKATWLASFSEYPLWRFRNLLMEDWLTFRHRYHIRYLLASLPRGQQPTSPVQGGLTRRQRYGGNRSLVTNPISDAQVRRYVDRLLDDNGEYEFGETRLSALEEIMRTCQDAGTQLVLVAAPMSTELGRNLPKGTLTRFDDLVGAMAEQNGVPYLTMDRLSLQFGPEDFREQSHLNIHGAEKLTDSVVADILLPRMTLDTQGMISR